MNEAAEIVTLPEVARFLRVADKTVYALIARNGLPSFKVGGQWRFRRAEFPAWTSERAKNPAVAGKARPQSRRSGRSSK